MNQIRRFASIIPPPVSSLKEIGKLSSKYPQAHPELFSKMKHFYKHVPKGSRVDAGKKSLYRRYYDAYIATNSPLPVVHLLCVMVPLGYYISYVKGGHYHPRREFH